MFGAPVQRDLLPGRDPHVVERRDVREKAVEPACAARPADDAAVEADGEQAAPFRAQDVERVDQVGREVVGGDEAVREQELEVVRVERVRDDEMVGAVHLDPVGQLVGVGVGVVEEAAVLDDEPARRVRAAAGVPPDGPPPADPLDRRDGALEMGALLLRREFPVVDPPPAVARHLPPGGHHRAGGVGVPLERLADAEDRERKPVGRDDAVHAPEPGPAAVLEHRLGVEVAPADRRRRADDLVQERLRRRVALERRVLAALLVVEDEADGDPGPIRPARVGRVRSVADEVAAHGSGLPNTPPAASSATRSPV
jgi:hypothetical protein